MFIVDDGVQFPSDVYGVAGFTSYKSTAFI